MTTAASVFDFARAGLGNMHATGWTAPTVIYEKMRQINVSAAALNGDITGNVAREAFKAAWGSWYAEWKAFASKYLDNETNRVAALSYTDELAAQTEGYRQQLLAWYDGYGREKRTDGKTVPTPSAPPPTRPTVPPDGGGGGDKKQEGFHIPWWGWMIGGVAVVGLGYLLYQKARQLQAVKRGLDTHVVPMVFQTTMGPQLGGAMSQAYAAGNVGHDPSAYALAPVSVTPMSTAGPYGGH